MELLRLLARQRLLKVGEKGIMTIGTKEAVEREANNLALLLKKYNLDPSAFNDIGSLRRTIRGLEELDLANALKTKAPPPDNVIECKFGKSFSEEIKDMAEIEAFYQAGSDAMGDAARASKIRGTAGLRKEPRLSLYDHQLDNILLKHTQMKSLIRKLFGNHLIWWFVPPSKYWHYIGMLSDIRGLFFGQKNIGTVRAYIQAMTVGLAGARAGSPVPFTTKARRRKFRKTLYSRAGYHRTSVGGHH